MIRTIMLGLVALALAFVTTTSVVHGQTTTPSPTTTTMPSPTSSVTVPSGAPSTGHGAY